MNLTLYPTTKIVTFDTPDGYKVPARIWEGVSESGIPVHVFVTRLAVSKEFDTTEFEQELLEMAPPSREVDRAYPQGIPIRFA